MILGSLEARSLRTSRRLDSQYFLSPGNLAAAELAEAAERGLEVAAVGDFADVSAPNRFKRAYAAHGEDSAPYLRPYDVFEYLPRAADYLSVNRTERIESYRVQPGTILQTCSGRNLGPAVVVDSYLAQFLISHDLVRIVIDDEELRHYVATVLSSPTGQALLRRDKTGSVIDHISVHHVADLRVPILPATNRRIIARQMKKAITAREEGRLLLCSALAAYEGSLPEMPRWQPHKGGWTVQSNALRNRLDAAPHSPQVEQVRDVLSAAGGVALGEAATVVKPSGRYKTYYVDADHGRPLLSGRQLLQLEAINLRYISPRSIPEPERYGLKERWICFQADGRSEERLGVPVVVTQDRHGWLASGHVGRIIPRSASDAGWLYLALATEHAQLQVKSLACGSVVDALYPEALAQVMLPPRVDTPETGLAATQGWKLLGQSVKAHRRAVATFEQAFQHAY